MSIAYKKGFTLVETIVALSLSLLVCLVVISTAVSSFKVTRTAKELERLHSNALYIANDIGYSVRQSARLSVPNATTLNITLPDLTKKTVTLSGTQILIDGVPITTVDIQVTAFQITSAPSSVKITYSLKSTTGSQTFSAETAFARRNPL